MNEKSKVAAREEEILKFWQENKIFEKSLEKPSPKGNFVFYEGPPTANAKPALHHLEARSFKDIIPRYKTMRGYHVPRKGGWDTHGLPVELQIEKKLGLKSKKDIEKYGIVEFNKQCKESVFEYISDWEKFTDRIGYWVDKDSAYYTFDANYIESVWNILKIVNDKKLLYKDYKVVPWCPRCGTALSSHELAQGYQDDKDLAVTVKFKLLPGQSFGINNDVTRDSAYVLAWTTTPWTLTGNVALAINVGIYYSAVLLIDTDEMLIVASDLVQKVFEGKNIKELSRFKGEKILNLKYEPLYPFLKEKFGDKNAEVFEKAYQVYGADFVNTEDGTGVVHTAVMYGQDDFELGTKIGLPKFHLVNEDGNFQEGMGFLSGRFVKDEEVAVEIIKDLAHRGLLFKKEKYEHSYPHCWRCKTPLIYYARDSWYIKMSSLREKLVEENQKINWVPAHIKEGRFGEWLREVKDWAISRERYWGTSLPIWQNEEGKNYVIGSIDELKERTKKSGNKYFVMRHGESEKNTKGVINCDLKNIFHLTEEGKKQAASSAKELENKNIEVIISSPFARCLETAEIVKDHLGLKEEIIIDERLWEIKSGTEYEGAPDGENLKLFKSPMERFEKAAEGGETFLDLNQRIGSILHEIEKKYENKNILLVSHAAPISFMKAIARGASRQGLLDIRKKEELHSRYADINEIEFVPLPHNENYELDLHRPYIDEVELVDENGSKLMRTKEVMDVWFDSGAMPFAQDHYPFDVNDKDLQYPADFISEAIDQTRGWFYTLHAIGVLMGKGKAYKNVICLGHILDAEGKKMSKSVGNIVDPWLMMDKYGVDALRLWMYTVNQPGDSKNFDEKTVDEIVKKVFNPTENIFSFYEMYSGVKSEIRNQKSDSENILDRWIISLLNKLIQEGGEYLDKFQIFEAGRLIRDFISDFSTWYIRRSRDRFKSDDIKDKESALSTTRFVLLELVKYMAPFTPFFAENIYQKLKSANDPESVHLCSWPEDGEVEEEVLANMQEVRNTVSLALEKRMAANIKVRQPLSKLKVKSEKLKGKEEYLELIKDEVNVKEITFDEKMEGDVWLDIEITEELQREGNVRELIRAVQDLRKNKNLMPQDVVELVVETDEAGKEFINFSLEQIKKPTNIKEIKFAPNDGAELSIQDIKFKICIP